MNTHKEKENEKKTLKKQILYTLNLSLSNLWLRKKNIQPMYQKKINLRTEDFSMSVMINA